MRTIFCRISFLLTFLLSTLLSCYCSHALAAHTKAKSFDVTQATIPSIHRAITRQKLTCENLIATYLQRIKTYNLATSRGGAINAFVSINPLAFDQARALDRQFAQSHQLVGSLHCIPVVVKDNIDTTDTPTTSGSLALLGSQPIQDAFLVAQLKKAGAIILGKGTMDELAFGGIGISGHSGRTGNAYNPTQSPGGSSGGPAAAVSASFALVGIGTDNSGSIRIPAAFNGIYGLRPSMGLVSQSGIFPRGNLDGIAGPLTRHVEDMAIVLSVIAQPNKHDKRTLNRPVTHDYQAQLSKKTSLNNIHIGVVKSVAENSIYKNTTTETALLQNNFLQLLKKQGAHLKEIDLPEFLTDRKNNMAGEVEQINRYLASFPSTRTSYTDICQSKRTLINHDYCLNHIQETAPQSSRAYTNTLKMFAQNKKYIEKVMQDNNLDVLLAPISAKGKADYDMLAVNTWQLPLSSNSGLPAIAINIGFSKDKIPMPVGMQFIGRSFDEITLLHIAQILEKNSLPLPLPNLGNPSLDPLLNNLSIAEMNNFFTLLGMNTFKQFLFYHRADSLTPTIFNAILLKTRNEFQALKISA
jgi:amidase